MSETHTISKTEATDQIFTALAKAQAEITPASKDATNPHFKSKYADLASVWDACRNALTRNGLCVVQIPKANGATVTVTTVLGHTSGQYLAGELTMTARDSSPQSVGSVLTYARRYSLSAFVSVAPDDDDGNAAQPHNYKEQRHEPEHKPEPKPEPSADWLKLRDTLYGMGVPKGNAMHANAVLAYAYEGASLDRCCRDGELARKALDGLLNRAAGGTDNATIYREALKAAGIEAQAM